MKIEVTCEHNQASVCIPESKHNFPISFQFMDRTSKNIISVRLDIESFKHFFKTLKDFKLDKIEESLELIEKQRG